MKRYLLDTHTLLWYDTDPGRLGKQALRVLQKSASQIFVSPISLFEMQLKLRRGKLPEAAPLIADIQRILQAYDFHSLDLTIDQAILAAALEWKHHDPFDRMIAAQALSENLVLLSNDRQFASLPGLTTLW